jgi:hypothetical protein
MESVSLNCHNTKCHNIAYGDIKRLALDKVLEIIDTNYITKIYFNNCIACVLKHQELKDKLNSTNKDKYIAYDYPVTTIYNRGYADQKGLYWIKFNDEENKFVFSNITDCTLIELNNEFISKIQLGTIIQFGEELKPHLENFIQQLALYSFTLKCLIKDSNLHLVSECILTKPAIKK